MKWILSIISNKPSVGAGITGGSFGYGILLKIGYTPEFHHMLNDFLQTAAFIVTVLVGILTIILAVRKDKRERNKRKDG